MHQKLFQNFYTTRNFCTASGSFLQKCINFVKRLIFSHFDGNMIPYILQSEVNTIILP